MSGWVGVGTKIYALKDGSVVIVHPRDSKHKPEKGAVEINSVKSISIYINPDEAIRADMNLSCNFEPFEVIPTYRALNPKTDKYEEVKSIEFASGDKWEDAK
jgi:hypothetical protein